LQSICHRLESGNRVNHGTRGPVDIGNSRGSDEWEQTGDQAEDLLQAKGERGVDLSVGVGQIGAVGATLGLMTIKTGVDFLEGCVSELCPWKLAITHGDNASDERSERRASRTAGTKTTEGGGTSLDGSDELVDNVVGAAVVHAAIELGNDGVGRLAEDVEGVLDFGDGPLLRVDGPILDGPVLHGPVLDGILLVGLGNGGGEGHSTGSEDSEDGRETHDGEAWEGYFGWKRLEVLMSGGINR